MIGEFVSFIYSTTTDKAGIPSGSHLGGGMMTHTVIGSLLLPISEGQIIYIHIYLKYADCWAPNTAQGLYNLFTSQVRGFGLLKEKLSFQGPIAGV